MTNYKCEFWQCNFSFFHAPSFRSNACRQKTFNFMTIKYNTQVQFLNLERETQMGSGLRQL